jgi:hypothetical protein
MLPCPQVPYYGETGLNAGIMHMDLTRMRALPDGWTGATMAMHDKYKARIKLADQDILNILFRCATNPIFSLYKYDLFGVGFVWTGEIWSLNTWETAAVVFI